MRVTVHLFARLRVLAGATELQCEVPSGSTIGAVWAAAAERHPELQAFAANVSCARNEDFAKMTTDVADGDQIAFLPPVSGG